MFSIFLLLIIVGNFTLKAAFRNCDQQVVNIGAELGLKYISQNIYRIPAVLKIDFGKTTTYLKSQIYQKHTKLYLPLLRKKMLPDLCIKFINQIFGYGVFTNEPIKKGQLVGEYVGEVVFAKNLKTTQYAFQAPIEIDHQELSIDASRYGNMMRFLNHSDQPNLQATYILDAGKFRLVFFAKKDIQAGQQLLIDYGKYYWSEARKKIKV